MFRAFASGAAGVFVAEMIQPHLEKIVKPDTDFAKKALKAGTAGIATAITWYATGLLPASVVPKA